MDICHFPFSSMSVWLYLNTSHLLVGEDHLDITLSKRHREKLHFIQEILVALYLVHHLTQIRCIWDERSVENLSPMGPGFFPEWLCSTTAVSPLPSQCTGDACPLRFAIRKNGFSLHTSLYILAVDFYIIWQVIITGSNIEPTWFSYNNFPLGFN